MARPAKRDLDLLRDALIDLTGVLNQPQPDAALLARAGVDIDRALFPLLVRLGRRGPLGIVELAGLCGRDYTTVSRQVTKLESLGLIERRAHAVDGRVREAHLTARGRAITQALDGAREALMGDLLAGWPKEDVADLARLLRRFADAGLAFAGRLPAAE